MDSTTTTEIRRKNLRILIKEIGGIDLLAKKLKMKSTQINQLSKSRSEARIGSWLAREIEHKLGLQSGWLDMPHNHLPEDASSIARKWLMLPPGIQQQIKDYIDLQLHSLRYELDYKEDDKTNFSRIRSRLSSYD